jgi:hypothetical protein
MPIYYEVLWFASRYSSFVTDLLDGMSDASDIIIYPLAIFSLVFVPLLTIVVPYLIVSRLFKRRLDFIVLSSRLWRIIAAIGFLILVNYTSLVLEQGLTFFSKA